MTLDRTTPPPVHMMGNLSLPTPHTEILPNGIILHHISGGTQDVNQLNIVWTGGCNEARLPSIARLTASMLREGTESMTGAQISEAIDFNGAMLKVMAEGHHTILDLSSLNTKTSQTLPIVRDIITSPTFPDTTFRSYRDMEAKEFMLSQNKVMVLSSQLLAPMIKGEGHPQTIIPTVADIEGISADDVRKYYSSVYSTAGCHAYLSGKITDSIYSETVSMLADLPAVDSGMRESIIPYHSGEPGYREMTLEGSVQAAVTIAIPAPPRSHPDYLPLRFAVMGLGGYFGSRLMKNIREDKGYTYGIGAALVGAKEGSYVLINAQTDTKYVEPLISEVGAELRRMADEPMADDELMRLKQFSASSLMETLDSPFSIMGYYKIIECIGLPNGYFDRQVELTHSIDKDTIVQMSKKYLDPDQMRIAVCR